MKVALIHDWLVRMRGGERVLEEFLELFPGADVYTLFYSREHLSDALAAREIQASALQHVPGIRQFYPFLLPLFPAAYRDLGKKLSTINSELGQYDLVIPISHCGAKNVVPPPDVFTLCYCLTPVRYLWDHFDTYFKGRSLYRPATVAAGPLRRWDINGCQHVDRFVAISSYVQERIQRLYNRPSDIVFPPVRTEWLNVEPPPRDRLRFLCVSALVPYKNVDKVIEAFNSLELPLTVVGEGGEYRRLKRIAGPSVEFAGFVPDPQLKELYRNSTALVFAAEEDFGIVPVEAQACGRPVICLAKGGTAETVTENTGVFFSEPTPVQIAAAVREFLANPERFTPEACRANALRFSSGEFRRQIRQVIDSCINNFSRNDDGRGEGEQSKAASTLC